VRVSYQPPPDPYQSAAQRPAAPAGQYSPDGRWYWNGQQWIPVTIPGPPWARPYAPPEGRSAAAVALVGLATAGFGILALGDIVDAIAVVTAPGSGFEIAGAAILLVGVIVYAAGIIGSAIAVPMWMHRAFRNLPALGEQGMRWSPAWAAGAWFIPIVNFFIPYQVMRELWSSCGDGQPLPQRWWTAWIAGVVVNFAGNLFARGNVPVSDLFSFLSGVCAVIAGFLLITMIRRATRHQRDRHDQMQVR
jgi:hypothetical protein